jgi:CRISPR-associated protein Csx3
MALRYPAVFLGGPAQSGKSWLIRHLSTALRKRGVMHYVLRAHPDGEGAWRYEAPPPMAAELRRLVKQQWTPAFTDAISRDLARRHLPLLVDTGGKPSTETEQILAHCTNAILLSHTPALLEPWRAMIDRQAIPLLADLHSIRTGEPQLSATGATLRGSICGLGPDETPAGPCLDLLIERLDALCRFEPALLRRRHAALTDLGVLDLEGPIGRLPAHRASERFWSPDEIPPLLGELEPGMPLALYGVGPTWLYSALAVFTAPAPIELFHVALGWVAPPPLVLGGPPDSARLQVQHQRSVPSIERLYFTIPGNYLNYEASLAHPLSVPAPRPDYALILDGKLPLWLYTALSRAYAGVRWLAIREPRGEPPRAVVIASRDSNYLVGSLIEIPEDAPAEAP